jgi:hypothetical protein
MAPPTAPANSNNCRSGLGLEATSPLPNNRQPDRVKPSTAFVTAVVLAQPSPTPMIDRRTAVVAALALGKAVGAEAELVAYPGKPHGFDFSDTDPMAADAIGRVVRLFEARLERDILSSCFVARERHLSAKDMDSRDIQREDVLRASAGHDDFIIFRRRSLYAPRPARHRLPRSGSRWRRWPRTSPARRYCPISESRGPAR